MKHKYIVIEPYGFCMLTDPHGFYWLFSCGIPVGNKKNLQTLHGDY